MPDKLKYYNLDDYKKQKQQQGTKIPSEANFFAAAHYVRDMFETKKMAYGVMGGLELLCLGRRRGMPDLHIAYEDEDFGRIKSKLESDRRSILPKGMNSLLPAKILVRTGPAFEDVNCTENAVVEVNLIPPGSCGTPSAGQLISNLVLLTLKPYGKLKTYKGLNMLHLVKTLLQLCRAPDLAWDPQEDILFLCQHYGAEIKAIQSQLDQNIIRKNFLGRDFLSKHSQENRRACYQALIGQEAPPFMTISPPPEDDKMHSRSGSGLPKPQLPIPKSSPPTNRQLVSELPSHAMPAELASLPENAASTPYPPVELSASPVSPYESSAAIIPPQELPGLGRESRSRYRPRSAPNSRKTSPQNTELMNKQRATSADTRYESQKPQATMNRASYLPLQTQQFRPIPVELPARLPVQTQSHPQLGLGGDYLDQQLRTQDQRPVSNSSNLSESINAQTGPQKPVIQSLGPSGIQSQAASQHASPADLAANQFSPHLALVTEKLRLVGPEGLYPAPSKPSPPAQPKKDEAPVFELGSTDIVADLSAHIDAALNSNQNNPSALVSTLYEPSPLSSTLSEPLPLQHQNQPSQIVSPISPPERVVSSTQLQKPNRPHLERTKTAPPAALPASLVVGGQQSKLHKSRSSTFSRSPPQQATIQAAQALSPPEFEGATFNASKYWSYILPPTTSFGNPTPPNLSPAAFPPQPLYHAHAHTHQRSQSEYKAYALPSTSEYKPYRPLSSMPPAPLTVQPATPIDIPNFEQSLPFDMGNNRSRSLDSLKDVHGQQEFLCTHKRDTSHDSVSSNGSHESLRLAEEYQSQLPAFEEGYGKDGGVGVGMEGS